MTAPHPPNFPRRRLALAAVCLPLAMAIAAPAFAEQPAAPLDNAEPVLTRARVTSFVEESDGRFYVRLTLLPRARLPFTTQAFRVRDRALFDGIPEGTPVAFTARHMDGENTVTSVRVVAECKRLQRC